MNILEARRRILGGEVVKRTAEGNPISVRSLARRYLGITMQGWTEQDSTNGYQLFDASLLSSHSAGGATVTNNGDGSFTISGEGQLTSVFSVEHVLTHEESINLLKVGKIRLKSDASTCPYLRVGIEDDYLTSREIDANRAIDITQDMLDDPQFTINLRIYANIANTIIPGTVKPMLYQDGDGTWEPYTGGAPSPSPDYPQEIVSAGNWNEETQKWEYEIEVGGANLFVPPENITKSGVTYSVGGDGWLVLNGTCTKEDNITGRQISLPSGYYTLSIEVDGDFPSSGYAVIAQIYSPSKVVGITADKITRVNTKYLEESNDYQIRIHLSNGFTYNNARARIMLNIGGVALPYEPCRTPQTVLLTSDRPLTKWDRLEKRDRQWGWVYKSDEYIFDSNAEKIYIGVSAIGNEVNSFYAELPNKKAGGVDVFSNKFKYDYGAWNAEGHLYGFSGHPASALTYFKVSKDIDTSEAFKIWMIENQVSVWYETAEETFVPLSTSEQEQMNALHTFRPTTVLSNDAGCEMSLTYKTKKSLEVTT